jgi:ribosomal protein S18 acetylase RimI-like enzyme
LRSAVRDNLAEFLLLTGRPWGAEERRDAVLDWTIGGSPLDYHNAVIPRGQVADADIAASLALMRARQVPGSWHVIGDEALGERLLARGFVAGGSEAGMAAVPSALAPAGAPEDLSISEVLGPDDLASWVKTLAAGFGEGPHEAEWVGATYARLGYGPGTPWRHYLGRLRGEPVATTTALTTGDVAGLYFVHTLAEARRRGIGSAMTRHAALDSVRPLAVLGASAMGEPVYRRLGFEPVCEIHIYEWRP